MLWREPPGTRSGGPRLGPLALTLPGRAAILAACGLEARTPDPLSQTGTAQGSGGPSSHVICITRLGAVDSPILRPLVRKKIAHSIRPSVKSSKRCSAWAGTNSISPVLNGWRSSSTMSVPAAIHGDIEFVLVVRLLVVRVGADGRLE